MVLNQGAWRQGLGRLMILDGNGYGRAFAYSSPRSGLFQVIVGGAMATLVRHWRPQSVPFDT